MIAGRLCYSPSTNVGGWVVIAHKRTISILDPQASPDTVTLLWEAITTPLVTLEDYVAAIPIFGPDSVASFAVAVIDEHPSDREQDHGQAKFTVVVRGDAAVEIDSPGGKRLIEARDTQPWYLAEFDAVTTIALGEAIPADVAPHRLLPLSSAVVDASFALWSAVDVPGTAADHGDTVLGLGTGGGAVRDDAVLGDTILSASARPFDDAREGATVLSRPAVAVVPPAPVPEPRPEQPTEDGPETGHAVYAFRIGAGQPYPLDTAAYVGRKPSYPRIPTDPMPRLVRVGSPRQEVSSTHVEIRQEGTAVVVTDLKSTNGTAVSMPGAARVTLRQGESIVVVPGTLVDIGDDNVVEILPAR